MADAMPGMAGLPPEAAEITPESLAAFEEMRKSVSSSQFSEDLLGTAAEADPRAVAEFKAELRELDLPPEALDMLNRMVDEILAAPDRYLEIRARYLAEGVDEELLPPAFDGEFFAALNLAVDEIRAGGGRPMVPETFAKGGIASLKPLAAAMAQQGRNGDTMLAHITPQEAQLLRRMGGSGSINPMTGLPEFFSLKKMFKKIGKAIKKFTSSTVGRIVTAVALGFFVGPAAASMLGVSSAAGVAAVSGFVGGAGSTLAAGGNLKDALKAGAIGGLSAGAMAGAFGGAQAFEAGSYTGATTISGQVQKAKDFFTGAGKEAALPDMGAAPAAQGATETAAQAVSTPSMMGPPAPFEGWTQGQGGTFFPPGEPTGAIGAAPTAGQKLASAVGMPSGTSAQFANASPASSQGIFSRAKEAVLDKISPSRIAEAGKTAADKAYDKTFAQYGGDALVPGSNAYATAVKAANEAAAKAMPSFFRQYGPMALTGLGVMGLAGGFKKEEEEVPAGWENFASGISPGQQLLSQNPSQYGLQFGGVQTTAVPSMYSGYGGVRRAKGSPAHGETKFPRKNGHISGPGTGTSDDIPAMLSDGEFVFTAKAVRGMGNGSRRLGAKKMYALMKKLEGHKNG